MSALKRLRGWRDSTKGAVGAAVLLVVCCALAPVAIGVAGFLAVGMEAATLAVVAVAVVAVLGERRGRGWIGCSATPRCRRCKRNGQAAP